MGGVWGLSGYPEIQTVGYRFREGHTLCTLNTSFVYFGKQYEHSSRYRRLNLSSLPNIRTFFSGSQKSLYWLDHPHVISILCLYIIDLVLVLNIYIELNYCSLDVKQ
jgi:hypothetical protein